MSIYRSLLFFGAITMVLSVANFWNSVEGSEDFLNSPATTQRVHRIQAIAFLSVACLALTAGLSLRNLEKKLAALGDTVFTLRETVATPEQQLSSRRVN